MTGMDNTSGKFGVINRRDMGDCRPAGGEVDLGFADGIEFAEAALDSVRARSARHSIDHQVRFCCHV